MNRTFALSFIASAEEVTMLQQAWKTLPDDIDRDVSRCFHQTLENRAYKLLRKLKDQIDATH